MKILFYRYGSICEPDLIEQFEKVGLEVVTVDPEITNKGLSSSERIDLLANILTKENSSFKTNYNSNENSPKLNSEKENSKGKDLLVNEISENSKICLDYFGIVLN